MPNFAKSPWSDLVVFLRGDGAFIARIVVIVLVAIVAMRVARLFVHGIVKALMDREATEGTAQELSAVELAKRMDTLDSLGVNVIRFFIFVIALITLLDAFSINIGPAVAGLGIVGVALGFGAQHLVKDYLNGALILVENQFSKGDVVRIAGVAGSVEDFSLRRTTLRDLDGNVHTVPNGEIAVASNLTRVWARVNEDVEVAYGTDIQRLIEVVDEVGRAMTSDPEWKRRILEAAACRTGQCLRRQRHRRQDPGHGPRARTMGGGRRAAEAAPRGIRRRRNRDPVSASRDHQPGRTGRAAAERGAAPDREPGLMPALVPLPLTEPLRCQWRYDQSRSRSAVEDFA